MRKVKRKMFHKIQKGKNYIKTTRVTSKVTSKLQYSFVNRIDIRYKHIILKSCISLTINIYLNTPGENAEL